MAELLTAEGLTAGYGDSIVLDRGRVVHRCGREALLHDTAMPNRMVTVA